MKFQKITRIRKFIQFYVLILILSISLGFISCKSKNNSEQTSPPVVTSSSSEDENTQDSDSRNNTAISEDTPIIIIYNDPMDPDSLTLGGTMAEESDGGKWSETNQPNDTLTIIPETTWSDGNNNIIINVSDESGNPNPQINLEFNVDSNQNQITRAISYSVNTPPAVSNISIPTNSMVNGSAQIVVTFSESMDISSLKLGGLMASESDKGVWSSVSYINDTFTISPAAIWINGKNRTLAIDVKDLLGNSLPTLNLSYTIDTSLPSASISFLNGTAIIEGPVITGTTKIILSFSESIDTNTLSLDGNMAAESNGGIWSTKFSNNDTLTISPSAKWTAGDQRIITIDCKDLGGNEITRIGLNFDILDGIVYVRNSDGHDDNPGTQSRPKKSIQKTIDLADSLFSTAEVHVAQGIYNVSYEKETHIVMKEGISIYGGYNCHPADQLTHLRHIR